VLIVHPEVEQSLTAGRPVVALESTIIAHGLPRPDNLRIAREIEDVVRDAGATPATVAILDGRVRIGLDDEALSEIASRTDVAKASLRDLGFVLANGMPAATTVASTAHLAARAGIEVFATGGLGGVHRGANVTFDESADLPALAGTGIVVVCAGVKSILDVAATLERLETLSVPLVAYRSDDVAGFYLSSSGHPATWRLDDPTEIAAAVHARRAIGLEEAMVVSNPLPEKEQMDPALHDRVLTEAMTAAIREGITGKDVTPFVLGRFHHATAGESLRANVALVLRNARLAAEIACALATP
jgi:pseudouridylate synthase